MNRRIAAVGKLLPWREADLARWLKDAGSGPLAREWLIQLVAPCPHTEHELASMCCGVTFHEYDDTICNKCREHAGFEMVCVACREPMEAAS
jgi:hypothetical protein